MSDCILCSIKSDSAQQIKFEDEYCLFAQNEKYQESCLHSGLIIPKSHKENVFELSELEIKSTFDILKKVRIWMDEEIKPNGYCIGWNTGRVAGQVLFHAHLHVIPRFEAEPFSGRGIRSWFKSPENKW